MAVVVVAFAMMTLRGGETLPTAGTPGTTLPAAAVPDAAPSGPGVEQPAAAVKLSALIDDLDAQRYDVRSRAHEHLRRLAQQPAAAADLAGQLERLLLRAETSFEARSIIEAVWANLPPDTQQRAATGGVADGELDRLVKEIDAPSYGLRIGAATRLNWLAADPKLAWAIAARVKRRLADAALSSETRKRLASILEEARGTWLGADPATWTTPTASDEQIARWVGDLASPRGNEAAQQAAREELLDLLAYDEEVARVRAALERRQAEGIADRSASQRVQELLEWTQPALVAEIWSNHQHNVLQYLLVGVPQRPEGVAGYPGAPRATHFDRIDDQTARCVSGNSLAPGDYPVGVALPPTNTDPNVSREGVMFHLVNLATPRRRLLFDYRHLQVAEDQRLRELSERTTKWLLAQKRPMTEREVALLRQLDFGVVSQFVGPYLSAIDDVPSSADDEYQFRLAGRTSRHAMLCYVLAELGTREAAPGLIDAIAKQRFLPPSPDAPYRLPWIAALSIAGRDPWSDCDTWLAGLIERTEALVTIGPESAELGATAAALLLKRHNMPPAEFGLSEVANEQMLELGCQGFRFEPPERRADVTRWWDRQKARLAKRDG